MFFVGQVWAESGEFDKVPFSMANNFHLNSGIVSWHMSIGNLEMMPRTMIWTGCLWICYANVPRFKKKCQLGGVHLELWRHCGVGQKVIRKLENVWDWKKGSSDHHCPTLQPWMGWAQLVGYLFKKLFKRRHLQWIEEKTNYKNTMASDA